MCPVNTRNRDASILPLTPVVTRRKATRIEANARGEESSAGSAGSRFLQFDPANCEREDEKLRRLNETCVREGWRKAIEEAFGDSPEQLRYNTDSLRGNFLELLPLTDESVVLEVGPALGHITSSLARRVKEVHALEVVPGQAEFTAERCRQEALTNVVVACGGGDCRLPYAGGSFDVLILNLVFEWCANRSENERFLDGQRRMLSEALRVLKPGGQLYLSTKNRYALGSLLGRRDEHVYGMRFGSVQPRWLMRWRLARRKKTRPLGLLHSYNQLQRLLADAGFARSRSLWASPEMRYPTHYIATDPRSVRAARSLEGFSQAQFRSARLLMSLIPAGLVKHVTPGLLFLATKPG